MVDITKRSVKGSPLTNDEVDTNFDNLNTGKVGVEDIGTDPNQVPLNQYLGSMAYQDLDAVSITGGTVVVDELSLGDNAKAIFGAGSDLQIYSDGENSILKENGGGNLIVNADNLNIVNSADTEYKAKFNTDGSVQLYYDNAEKFSTTATGIDVTGTVTADGLTVDTGGSAVEFNHSATGPTLRFNNTDLTVADGQQLARIEFSTDDTGVTTDEVYLQLTGDGTGGAAFFDIMTGDGTPTKTARFNVGGDISFYEDTGTTAKFFWDASAESLGIGTSSPADALHVNSGTSNEVARFESTDGTAYLSIMDNSTSSSLQGIGSAGNDLTFYANNAERMRIDSSGNVGIGTSSPSDKFHVANGSVGAGYLRIANNEGYARFGTDGGALLLDVGGSEAARIDSSGNLLVGKTSVNVGTSGTCLRGATSSIFTVDGSVDTQVAIFNRTSNDGTILDFRKDGTTVGRIGARGDDVYLETGDTGIRMYDQSDAIIPVGSGGVSRDAAIDLGLSNIRFKNLYLSGGVYLGGTGAANLLDDYEEGTWTPTYEGDTTNPTVTYDSFTSGRYTKIGNIVIATFTLRTDSVTGGSGDLKVSGLPFTVVNAAGKFNTGAAILSQANSFGGNFPLEGVVRINSTEMGLLYRTSVNGAQSPMDVSDLGTGANANVLVMTVIYEAA